MQVGFVVAQTVDDVQRFAIVGADDLGVERQTKIRSVAVDRWAVLTARSRSMVADYS
jgi:hypothetical protein